jgi:hypothetical protein
MESDMNLISKLGCGVLVILTGCLPSLNPAFDAENSVFDPAVMGTWTQAGSQARWEFSRRDDRSYGLVYTDNDGQQGRFVARLVKLQDSLFLDLFPEEIEGQASAFYKFHLVPIHTIYRVQAIEPRLTLSAIDYKWLEKFLAEHPDAIQYATFNGRKLISAPTEDVQEFLREHKETFTGNFHLERKSEDVR